MVTSQKSPPYSRRDEVVTKDLFLAAFLLTCQSQIKEVVLTDDNSRNGRTYFVIDGPEVTRLEKDYASGQAQANVKQLKETLKNVKDIMFDRIRSAEFSRSKQSKEQSNNEIHRRIYTTT